MSSMIRLLRQGAKGNAQFAVVVTSDRGKRDGGFLAKLGTYNPAAEKAADKIKLNKEAAQKWLAKGARPTTTVAQLIKIASK